MKLRWGPEMATFILALKSLSNRRWTALLVVFSIALSVALLMGVERVRTQTRAAFANTLSGTDLVVGARTGGIALLLQSVFRIGYATNNVSWESYQEIAKHPRVQWTIPISLGDSHRDFAVLGTNDDYFRHYKYGRSRHLELAEGNVFSDVYDAVLGSEVAHKLEYQLNQSIVIAHGAVDAGISGHDDKPFKVVGILKRTGTPVDRTVHVSLNGLEALHVDWQSGMRVPLGGGPANARSVAPRAITAFLVGLDSRTAVFYVQRFVNDYRKEALAAVLPGVALQELWDVIGVAEKALLAVSALVALVGLCSMVIALLTGLNERRREMAILRSVGARPRNILALVAGEAIALTLAGIVVGMGFLYLALFLARPIMQAEFGISLALGLPSPYELVLMATMCGAGLVAGLVPAVRAYRYSIADGMTVHT